MVQLVLHRTFYKGHIAFDLPEDGPTRQEVTSELTKCRDKYNDYVLVTLQRPKRARTTGEGSQNNHFWGHITQIAQETGNIVQDVEDAIKDRALSRGYPYDQNKLTGRITPKSTTEVDTVEMGYLIDETHILAAELGITLKETNNE